MQSQLIQAMLARQLQNTQKPMPSLLEAIGNIAMTAALAKGQSNQFTKEKADAMTQIGEIAPHQDERKGLAATLESIDGGSETLFSPRINESVSQFNQSIAPNNQLNAVLSGIAQSDPQKAQDLMAQMILNRKAVNPEYDFATITDPEGRQARIRTPKAAGGKAETVYTGGKKEPGVKVATTVNTGPNAFEQGVGKEAATAFGTEYESAKTAAAALPSYDRALQLLDSGIISGTGADARLAMARALKTAGIYDGDVSNTDEYLALTGKFVAEEIKAFGAGTGLSDADREFARKMAGGEIAVNADSLRRILNVGRKARANKIDFYNKRRESLLPNYPVVGTVFPMLDAPEIPSPAQDRRSRAGL